MATLGKMAGADIGVIVAYFVVVIVVGVWSSWRSTRGTLGGFFLAGRSMNFLLVGASLFGSNIGSGHFVGIAGSAAAGGIAVGGFELNAIFVLIILGWLFVPVYLSSGVFTMPEYLQKRFGGRWIQVYLSVLALLLYVLTKISADLFAGAIFLNTSFELNTYVCVGILLAMASFFTVIGGLTAVIWTDAVQVVIMIIGAAVLMVKAFVEVGGFASLHDKYTNNVGIRPFNASAMSRACWTAALARKDAFQLLRHPATGDLPGTGMAIGLTIASVWYWCSDQVIVQRVLSAKNFTHAKGGCVFAAWLKFLPLFLIVFPGMIARVLYADELICYSPDHCKAMCGSTSGCANRAYAVLVLNLLPAGMRGLMIAVMLSALMSSLTSVFNSGSTIFTMDLWPLMRPNATSFELLIVGRVFIVLLMCVSFAWIPVISSSPNSQLFDYIQATTIYLAPPICAVYVLAVFWPRCNEQGAFWSLMVGLVVGITRFILESAYGNVPCNEIDNRPDVLTKVHYLHFAIILFTISIIVAVVVSLLTRADDEKYIKRLTFWSRHDEAEPIERIQMSKICNHRVVPEAAWPPIEEKPVTQPSLLHRIVYSILGANESQTVVQVEPPTDIRPALDETTLGYWFVNANAIVVVIGAIVCYAVFQFATFK